MEDFTHFNEQGRAKMVDVGEKPVSRRTAVAAGRGSTVFSRRELDHYAQQNLTVRAIDPPCLRELGVAMRPAVQNNPVARSLLRALRRAAADDIA